MKKLSDLIPTGLELKLTAFKLVFEVAILITIFSIQPIAIGIVFLLAVIVTEGYRLLALHTIKTDPSYRIPVGVLSGFFNGLIYVLALEFTGNLVFFWPVLLLLVFDTAYFYGAAGTDLQSVVSFILMVAFSKWTINEIVMISLMIVLGSVFVGWLADQLFLYKTRFEEVSKRSELTKERRIRFVGLVSHILRTPLTSIRGYIDILKNGRVGKLSESQSEVVEKLSGESAKLASLAEELLSVSNLENESVKINRNGFDFVELLVEISKEYKRSCAEASIEFIDELSHDDVIYEGDKVKLEMAIKNLLDNSIKFTPKGGKVTLKSYTTGDAFVIEVIDTGIGIPKEELNELFVPFKRGSNVLEYNYKGTGLGLYTTKLIVEAHDGRIEVTSQEGRGSKFKLLFPLGPLGKFIANLVEK